MVEQSGIDFRNSEQSDWPAKSSIRGAWLHRVVPRNPAVSADTTSQFCVRFGSADPRWRRGSLKLTASSQSSQNQQFRAPREIAPSVSISTFLPLGLPSRGCGPRRWISARSKQRSVAPDMRLLPAPRRACGCCATARMGLFSEHLTVYSG